MTVCSRRGCVCYADYERICWLARLPVCFVHAVWFALRGQRIEAIAP